MTRIMMQNPKGRPVKRRARKARKAVPARRRVAKRAKVSPPRKAKTRKRKTGGVPAWVRAKGFSSFAAYMASIRPGGKTVAKRKRKAKSSGAKRRRRSAPRRKTATAAAPKRRARRRGGFRRNPGGSLVSGFAPKALLGRAIDGLKDGAAGTAGMAVARFARGKMNLDGNTVPGSLAELGIAILTAPIVEKFAGREMARAWTQGAFMGPMITAVKSAHVPYIAPALGDEGELPLFGGVFDLGSTYELGDGSDGATGASNLGGNYEMAGEEMYS